MSKVQKTVKLNEEVYEAAEASMAKGGHVFNFSTLAEAAIRKFITEAQSFEPVTLGQDEANDLMERAMRKHKVALDRMK